MDYVIMITLDKDIFDEDCLMASKVYKDGKVELGNDFKGEDIEKVLSLLFEKDEKKECYLKKHGWCKYCASKDYCEENK